MAGVPAALCGISRAAPWFWAKVTLASCSGWSGMPTKGQAGRKGGLHAALAARDDGQVDIAHYQVTGQQAGDHDLVAGQVGEVVRGGGDQDPGAERLERAHDLPHQAGGAGGDGDVDDRPAPGQDAARLGEDGAVRVRTFRLIVVVAQELRTLMDQLLRADGLTTQQAALITVVDLLGTPSLSQAATALGTTHQNARQLADALERKGFLQISADQADARVRRLSTTAKSDSYWRDRSAADQQQVLDWFSDLTPAEAQTLFELLAKVEHRARAELSKPTAGPDTKPGRQSEY
jgi:DNA-binding MarR family transcriptional regulator